MNAWILQTIYVCCIWKHVQVVSHQDKNHFSNTYDIYYLKNAFPFFLKSRGGMKWNEMTSLAKQIYTSLNFFSCRPSAVDLSALKPLSYTAQSILSVLGFKFSFFLSVLVIVKMTKQRESKWNLMWPENTSSDGMTHRNLDPVTLSHSVCESCVICSASLLRLHVSFLLEWHWNRPLIPWSAPPSFVSISYDSFCFSHVHFN